MFNVNPNIRRSRESQEAYKLRLRSERQASNKAGRGTMLWPSEFLGSYVRRLHGELNEKTAGLFINAVQRLPRMDKGALDQ